MQINTSAIGLYFDTLACPVVNEVDEKDEIVIKAKGGAK